MNYSNNENNRNGTSSSGSEWNRNNNCSRNVEVAPVTATQKKIKIIMLKELK